jgi:Fe-S oxidoreductase
MWMEENIGKRINMERVDEAISTETDTIATGCPFCRVMLTDGLTERQSEAKAVGTEVMDVSQMLLAAVKRGQPADGDGPGDSDPATTATSANVKNPAE